MLDVNSMEEELVTPLTSDKCTTLRSRVNAVIRNGWLKIEFGDSTPNVKERYRILRIIL